MSKTENVYEIDLLKLLQTLLNKAYIIVICAFLVGTGSFAYSTFYIKPTYKSEIYVYVNNSSISVAGQSLSFSSSDLTASKSLVSTYEVILKTRNTLETVIKKANLDYSYEKLKGMISSSAVNNTEVFSVSVTSTDPKEACLIANTIAEVFPDKVASIVTGTSAKIVDYGVVNSKKVAPNRTRYTLIGLIAGALIACVFITINFLLDDSIDSEEYLTENFDIPVLAIIPSLLESKGNYKKYNKGYYKRYYKNYYKNYEYNNENKKAIKKRMSQDQAVNAVMCEKMHFDAKEAYRLLRTNIQFTIPNFVKCKIIGVTSSIRGEGKSTTSINLAYTIAQTNKRVLLIDGDMRLPSISTKTGIKNALGLSDLIIGNANSSEVLNKYKNVDNFDILLSGSIPPNPSELLGSNEAASIIGNYANEYDYIIVDLPPVNIVSDALVTNSFINGLVVVVREGLSDKHSLSECVGQLQFIKSNILGFVLTDSRGGTSYYRNNKHYYNKYGRYKRYAYYRRGGYYGYRNGHSYDYSKGYSESKINKSDNKGN